MTYRFPLSDVTIKLTEERRFVNSPAYREDGMQISQNEFSLTVEGTAHYYACNGKEIFITPEERANLHTLELYLNGSVYGAILHQRSILPLHGSCFNYKEMGIMICGESGAGKSSLTASFCLNGAEFLTDDVTPIQFIKDKPHIWAMSDRIKLWADSLEQLEQEKDGLHQIDLETEKYFFPMNSDKGKHFPLHQIFLLEIHNQPEVKFQELAGVEKFTALRNEIYRWEYLQAMPATEATYFKQLVNICKDVKISKLFRPDEISIEQLHTLLKKFLGTNALKSTLSD